MLSHDPIKVKIRQYTYFQAHTLVVWSLAFGHYYHYIKQISPTI